ncbi:GNAT family N-acetyltransferase [Gehongia tenuis]|uniref:GNAT family N-acetyltransferase n=1 Tax=Gehongia tenuis TaxID=2763655 RepID=A0A926HR67_9FIRM|nr:GNAT family N-acetyltransferase [Gehongia tenuis]MBC8531981.1 GNAT family N-acetyltransferase [Gehongia tenuis]
MLRLNPPDTQRVSTLFLGMDEVIIRGALEGAMGEVWADDTTRWYRAARISLGDFWFLGGDPRSEGARELVDGAADGTVLVCQSEDWHLIVREIYGDRIRQIERYALEQKSTHFDEDRLTAMTRTLPEGCRLAPLDAQLAEEALRHAWCREWVEQFDSPLDFARRGLGMCALCKGEIVAGAASYGICRGEIEIQVTTRKDFRKRGLAKAVSAALILECIQKRIRPNWDAAHRVSACLAQSLGYGKILPYPAFEVGERKVD